MLLFIHCLLLFPLCWVFGVWSCFGVVSDLANNLRRMRELAASL